jgi:probable F420-dependent oxidoreductase
MTVKIGVGFGSFRLGLPDPGRVWDFVDKAEAWGADSIWLSDHVVARFPSYDAMTVLAMFVARTRRLKLGTSVLLLPTRNPVQVAKSIATMDVLSGGRVILGVGLGRDPREYEVAGVPFHERGRRLDEAIRVIRKVWTESPASLDGTWNTLRDIRLTPMPTKKPTPDLWVGGDSDAALRRVARLANGWFASRITPEHYRRQMDLILKYAVEYGRGDEEMESGILINTCLDSDRAAARERVATYLREAPPHPAGAALDAYTAFGPREDCIAAIERYVAVGADKFVLWPACPPEELLAQLERICRDILPHFAPN